MRARSEESSPSPLDAEFFSNTIWFSQNRVNFTFPPHPYSACEVLTDSQRVLIDTSGEVFERHKNKRSAAESKMESGLLPSVCAARFYKEQNSVLSCAENPKRTVLYPNEYEQDFEKGGFDSTSLWYRGERKRRRVVLFYLTVKNRAVFGKAT